MENHQSRMEEAYFSDFCNDRTGPMRRDSDDFRAILGGNFLAKDEATSFQPMPLDLSNLYKLQTVTTDVPYCVKYKSQEGKTVKIWECKICNKEFAHQYTLMRHLPTHTDERKYQCTVCGKAFRQMSTLSQHKAIHSQERPYVCEVCQKTFNRVSTLISHRKTHTGFKPHQCHLCKKSFHQKGNLRNHIFTHTNERPYKCENCGKGFNQMSNLMCHKLKAHQLVEKPKYSCQICCKDFLKRVALRNHEQYEHGSNSQPESTVIDDKFSSNVIFVDPIKTKAMQLAIESNKTPFALLRPLSSIPVLVKVLPGPGNKQMLVPAHAEDLKKYGQISVIPKTVNEENKENLAGLSGNTVKIKIPVVATVIQQSGEGGHLSMSVLSPGPGEQNQTMEQGKDLDNFLLNTDNSDDTIKNIIVEDIEEICVDSSELAPKTVDHEEVIINE